MIRLTKQPKPQILIDNATAWTNEYLKYIQAGGSIPSASAYRYRHDQIRAGVEVETSKKCAYCEVYIKPAGFGDVEHILPKGKYPQLYVNWENLTLACEVCNRGFKKEHDNPPLVNPYTDDPNSHFMAEGPCIFAQLNNPKGKTTETILQLNRPELVLKRAETIKALLPMLEQWQAEADPAYKAIFEMQLRYEAGSDREFAFVVRDFLAKQGVP